MRRAALPIAFLLALSVNNLASADSHPHSCTIFTVSAGEEVLFGSNEDYTNPNTYYWAIPPQDGRHGGVYFGFDDLWPQGGVNEVGLAFDINALTETALNPHPELPSLDDYEGYLVLGSCATVEEAIELVKGCNWGEAMWGQIHFADAAGDAVVVGPGEDGELAFTRKEEGDGFLVSTNFNLAFHDRDERKGLCSRYDKAVEMLNRIGSEQELGMEYCADILDAVHAEGRSLNTLYSYICDLKNGDVYLYYFHQFDEVVKMSVAQEISGGHDPTPIRDLFSEETVKKASEEYEGYRGRPLLTCLILVVAIILILSAFAAKSAEKRERR